MAIEQNIELFLGEDRPLVVTVLNAAGTAEDITGWTLSWMLKRRAADADEAAILVKANFGSPGDGLSITAGEDGMCEVTLEDEDTEDLPARTYRHELKRMDDGFEAVLLYGNARLVRGVHHA